MEDFKWTTELTQNFLHIRLQNEWLFKKKKQAWKDLYKIMIENHNFPANMTFHHIRKKWTYTIDEYHRAVAQNNTSWLYFDTIHSYLGESNGMEAFPNWTDEWINRLIDIRIQKESTFSQTSNAFEAWNNVECQLRGMGLPVECSVRKIDQLWCTLVKTFKLKRKFYKDGKSPKYKWPFYDVMKNYFESHCLDGGLSATKTQRTKKRKYDDSSDDDSDNECLNDLKKSIMKSSEKQFSVIDVPKHRDNTDEDFRWSPQWTESFIHIRLQNESLFKQKKQPWKDLHAIMMEHGFPEGITVKHIRTKWNFTFEEYRKAVATNNTKWIYYYLIHSYLSEADSLDAFKSWTDDWIRKFIQIMSKNYLIFINQKLEEDECWMIVESQLRRDGIPTECSVRNLHLMWSILKKTFKEKHKYVVKNNSKNTWQFYDDMRVFNEKYDPDAMIGLKISKTVKQAHDSGDDEPSGGNDFEMSEDHQIKDEELTLTCRVCLETSETMLPLFKPVPPDDLSFSDKIMACSSVQVTPKDFFPQGMCQRCADELNAAYKFKKKCEDTDHILKTTWLSRQGQAKNIKDEISAIYPLTGENYEETNVDNCSIDYYSDNELRNDVLKDENKEVFNSIFSDFKKKKRKVAKPPPKQNLPKKKAPLKSKHCITIPVVTESGKTIYKRKYVYWKVCYICGKSSQKLSEHLKGHLEVKTHKCHLCPKTFTYNGSLQTHLKTHNPTPLKICQLCGKEFFRNLTYKRHLMYHANERNFSCETCGKAFNTKDILRVHIRSHTGERPYSCKTCGKSFFSRGCVSRHQKVHRRAQVTKLADQQI